ncbi:MAG: N-formylglutamate amidohydrolase [Pseudomonadota bacterium]
MTKAVHLRHDGQDADFAPRVENPEGRHPVLLVCEHASARLPDEYGRLGLQAAALESHIAWDPGALDTARRLSTILDAPLVYSTVSRLIYDCNRPAGAETAMPERSEDTVVPGNVGLTDAERRARVERFYRPFEALLSDTLTARPGPSVLATVHSFTPVYRGHAREVEIGILHDTDSRLADALLEVAAGFNIQRNAPYGPADGVTHTLRRHALPQGFLNVMFEIRNDLIGTLGQCAKMAETLAGWLESALVICDRRTFGNTGK